MIVGDVVIGIFIVVISVAYYARIRRAISFVGIVRAFLAIHIRVLAISITPLPLFAAVTILSDDIRANAFICHVTSSAAKLISRFFFWS